MTQSIESLTRAESSLADWQVQWDEYTLKCNEAEQVRNVEQTRAEQIESRIKSLGARRKKLDGAQVSADLHELKARFEKLAVRELRMRQGRDEFDRHLKDIAEKIHRLRKQDDKLNRLCDERRAMLQTAEAKFASLDAIQKAALGQSDDGVKGWFEAAGLQNRDQVAQSLEVENAWGQAVETVLGRFLQAVCVDDVTSATAALSRLQDGSVTLLIEQAAAIEVDSNSPTLAAKVKKAPAAVVEILRSVRVADSLDDRIRETRTYGPAAEIEGPNGISLEVNDLRVGRRGEIETRGWRCLEEIESSRDDLDRLAHARKRHGRHNGESHDGRAQHQELLEME